MLVQTTADLGALIRDRRRELGLDQKELAERTGVSRYWIIGIEGGKARAETGLVLRTLRTLGLVLDVRPAAATKGGQPKRSTTPSIDLGTLMDTFYEKKKPR